MKLFVGEVVKDVKIVSMGVMVGFLLSQQPVDLSPQRTPCAAAGTTGPPAPLLRRPSRICCSSGLSSGTERKNVTVRGLRYDGFWFGRDALTFRRNVAGKMKPELEEVPVEDSVKPM